MEKSIFLNIAGFNIQINFKPTEWEFAYKLKVEEINKYWSGFMVNKANKINYEIDFVEENHIKTIDKIKEKTRYLLFYRENGSKKLTVNYLISIFHFQILLRQIINDLLSQNNGFILHGSSNLINNRASIFLALSGGGKSTIMKLLNLKYLALADDTVIIRKEKGQYYLYQTPFIEKESWILKNNKKYKLKNIYFLKKSKKYLIGEIKDSKIKVENIFKQFWSVKDSYKKQIKTALNFILSNNFYNIYFGLDSSKLINLLNKYD